MKKAALFFPLFILAAVCAGCWCAPMGDDDDSWGEDVDVACSCLGLSEMIYDECNGTITADGATLTRAEFEERCATTLEQDGEDAALYECYIEAACTSDDCEEAADRLDLCNL